LRKGLDKGNVNRLIRESDRKDSNSLGNVRVVPPLTTDPLLNFGVDTPHRLSIGT